MADQGDAFLYDGQVIIDAGGDISRVSRHRTSGDLIVVPLDMPDAIRALALLVQEQREEIDRLAGITKGMLRDG